MPNEVWDEITYPIPNFNSCIIELLEWNFTPHLIIDVITYPAMIKIKPC